MPLPLKGQEIKRSNIRRMRDYLGRSGPAGWRGPRDERRTAPRPSWNLISGTWWKLKLSALPSLIPECLQPTPLTCLHEGVLLREDFMPVSLFHKSPTNIPRRRWALPRIPSSLIFHIKKGFHISFCTFSNTLWAPQDLPKYFIHLSVSRPRELGI